MARSSTRVGTTTSRLLKKGCQSNLARKMSGWLQRMTVLCCDSQGSLVRRPLSLQLLLLLDVALLVRRWRLSDKSQMTVAAANAAWASVHQRRKTCSEHGLVSRQDDACEGLAP